MAKVQQGLNCERKKLITAIVVIYTVGFHFVYNYYLKDNIVFHSGVKRIISSIWNLKSSPSNGTEEVRMVANAFELDVHLEHPILGHTGEVSGGNHSTHIIRFNITTIAIGGGITSKRVPGINKDNIATKFQLFNVFLPTFCRTASPGYEYRFYFAYDVNDPVFTNATLHAAFQKTFTREMKRLCDVSRNITSSLHMVQCSHTGKPTWAQNDAMLEAYLDHIDYFYRINDDTKMQTGGWVEAFITALNRYNPPRIGVVGPKHTGGNTGILTYDFVHRTHIDMFGFYYPRIFTDWFGDSWMTDVYRPNRSSKLKGVRVAHTLALGRRYQVHKNIGGQLRSQVTRCGAVLKRYIEAVKRNKATGVKPDGRKVISMSLYGKDPRYTWGVIRNAQLVPVYLPEWTLRVYVTADPAPSKLAVPPRIINKLRLLGAEIAIVPTGNNMAPRNWRLLAAIDQQLDYFLVRDADARLSEREATAVREWVSATEKTESRAVIHCIRDHPKHANQAIVDGLWGGRPGPLSEKLNKNFTDIPDVTSLSASSKFWTEVLWPAVADVSYCHDSVSPCHLRTPTSSRHSLPIARSSQEYLGQKFDEHQQLASDDANHLKSDVLCPVASTAIPLLSTLTKLRPTPEIVRRPNLLITSLHRINATRSR